ncbi:hypothetical protein [Plantactinospora soyae]|uniref:Uncharacterized protein n=1 Tax=Plantactinospora soyae TaxID=1544732 RepID=A0A927M9N0_9ACTN|nr:hypothetical protein [Plantactinospora soyae]MBE1490552.1 hypothetical protein [Plantactinospora soyae]
MADRTPVDVVLSCPNEADVSLRVLLGEDRAGWWSAVPANLRPGVAKPYVPDADPGRQTYGPDPAAGATGSGTR